MSAQPTINGQHYTHVSVTCNIEGRDYYGVSDLSYGTERDTVAVFGTGPNQVGVALGPVKHSGSMEMVKLYADRLRAAIGDGYMSKPLTITVTFRESQMSVLSTTVLNVYIKKDDTKSTQGSDPTKETIEFHVNDITRNGLRAAEQE